MERKIKKILSWAKKHIIQIAIVIITVTMLSINVENIKFSVGDRSNWLSGVSGYYKDNSISAAECGVTSYTAYNEDGSSYVVTIDAGATEGTEKNPYAIRDEIDLVRLGRMGWYKPNYYYILTADEYDMKGDEKYTYPLIGTRPSSGSEGYFMGTLIGNNATIKNIYVQNSDNYESTGLFGKVVEGAIWDLNVENLTVITNNSAYYNGGLIGYSEESLFVNCNVEYNVDHTNKNYNFSAYGSLIGRVDNKTSIFNCTTTMKVDNGEKEFGMYSLWKGNEQSSSNNVVNIKNEAITVKSTSNLEMNFNAEDGVYCEITSDGTDIYMDTVPVKTTSGIIITVYDDGSYSFDATGVTNPVIDINNGQHTDITKRYCNVTVDPNYDNKEKVVTVVEYNKDTNAPNVERTGFDISGWSETKDANDINAFPYKTLGTMNMWLYWEVNLDYDVLNAVKDITKDNVKNEDKDALTAAKEKLIEISRLDGLTQDDVSKIQTELDRIEDALDKIEELINPAPETPMPISTPKPTESSSTEPSVTPTIEPTEGITNTLDDNIDEKQTTDKEVDNVSTGDRNNIVFWSIITLMSGMGIVLLVRRQLKINK